MKYKDYLNKLKNKKTLLMLLLIVILGFVLRVYHLGVPSLWLDELRTKHKIALVFTKLIEKAYLSGFPPLYYIILHFWIKIFGTSESSLRFPSLIFSVLSIIFIFKLSKELFNENVGLISAFLLSVWPYSINYAQEAKMYAMIWSLGILSCIFFYRFLRENKMRDLSAYVITSVISVYTMYLGLLYIVIQNIIFFFSSNNKQSKRWLLGQLAIILMYLPWINHFFIVITGRNRLYWSARSDQYLGFMKNVCLNVTGSNIGKQSLVELFLYCFLIISSVIGLKRMKNNRKNIFDFSEYDHFLFFWIFIPIIIFYLIKIIFAPVLFVRHLGFIHIPLIILLSEAINKYDFKVKCALLIFLFFSIFANHLYPYYKGDQKINGQNWRSLAVELDKRIVNNDLIVFSDSNLWLDYCTKRHKVTLMKCSKFYAQDFDKLDYDSIFLVYTLYDLKKKCKILEIKGYKLEERIQMSQQRIGFFHFRK